MYVLELHQDVKNVKSDPEVCKVCFGVITKYLEGNSSKNKNYITELVDFLFTESVSSEIIYNIILNRRIIILLIRFGELLLKKTKGLVLKKY
jgi:hypothetical protein